MEEDVPIDNSITLELGDIIEIIAPNNQDLHEIAGFISYIDSFKIKLVNISTKKNYQLNITDSGTFTDESIQQIHLLSRSNEPGYARQNNLIPRTWLDVYFGGEIPIIVTGEITNLEEDMIEITTYPELIPIYINFAYQGIPENIPIEKIIVREKPASLGKLGSLSLLREQLEEGEIYEGDVEQDLATIEYTESGESIIRIPEGATMEENVRDNLHELYLDANTIVFGERLEEIAQLVELPEGQQRFGIDTQVNDLMDELLSTIPSNQRTKQVLDNIHQLIERFKELRTKFSQFDTNQNAFAPKTVGAYFKPLINNLVSLKTNLRWILPVVSNRRKIYDVDVAQDTTDTILEQFYDGASKIETMTDSYYKNNSKDPTLTYSSMQNQIQTWINPFELPLDHNNALIEGQVMTDIDTIVDNLDDFYSSVFANSNLVKRKFVVQRYNLGLSKLQDQIMKNGKTVYTRVPMTPNDSMQIKSIVMLPSPVVRFSTIDLPMTSILDKTTLHQNMFLLFRLLRKNTDIIPHVIEDLSLELDYDKMEKDTKQEFLSGIHEFLLEKDIYVDQYDKYRKFLEIIIPKTKFLIRSVHKYITDKVSFISVVKALEPFLIYSQDITFAQYKEIRTFINERIKDYKQNSEKRGISMGFLRNAKYNVSSKMNNVLRLLTEKKDFADSFFQTYSFLAKDKLETKLTPQEILLQMTNMDNGNLYMNVLTSIMISLMTPNLLLDALYEPKLDDMTDNEKIKPTDCTRRYLAKKYTSVKELQKDNNVEELFYDKDFDDTPYDILSKYKDQQKVMLPDLFLEFLIENLIHMHDCPPSIARELALTLIAKKKRVTDGEYAILELRPQLPANVDESTINKASIEIEADVRKKIQYYRRLKNNWVKDDDIEDESFIDTNTLFCNVSKNCLKNTKNNVCESLDITAARMQQIAKKKMVGEFDKRYSVQIEELEVELEKNIDFFLKLLKKIKILNEVKLRKPNNLAFELGNIANTEELLFSPHLKLRDLILGQDDFVKKQQDICRFVQMFCREPMMNELDESPVWLYCIDTNTKLFPESIHILAVEFTTGGDYLSKLNILCNKVGILSDDGDSIVDKYSGFVLRKIDFSGEEGFDESTFRITSNEILEKDLGTVSGVSQKIRVFENETIQTIFNILSTICSNIDIPIDSIEEFVLRVSNEFISTQILSEETYKKRSAANEKKTGKPFKTTFQNYRNETIIIIISSVLLIAIQTAIPAFTAKKTFPGCKLAFDGFPMDGIENISGIEYISCVLHKTKSSVPPWSAIQSYKPDVLAKRLKTILEDHIMKRTDIQELYVTKREYLILNPLIQAPPEHRIEKWRHFLPPLVDFSILKKLHNVSSDFQDELIQSMQKGSKTQHQFILVLKSKLIRFGYGLIESIRNIVEKKTTLLRTSAQIPFLENACCNENIDLTNPIKYFIREDESIINNMRSIMSLVKINKMVRSSSTAPMIYHAPFTGIRYPNIPTGQLDENIYAAVFYYCNFDRIVETPIPEEFKVICNAKPTEYKKNWTIQEKMEFFKKNGKRFDLDNLHQLMKIVNLKNKVVLENQEPFSRIDLFKEIIENLDMENSTIIESRLREHLHKVLDKYDPKTMRDVPSPELEGLTKYLLFANQNLYKSIMDFFDNYRKLSDREYKQIHEFLSTIYKWQSDEDTGYTFIINAIQNISKIYPEMLINNTEISKKVPKHWDLSSVHENDIVKFITKYYQRLSKFKNDTVLVELLQSISNRFTDVWLFVQNIPLRQEVTKNMDIEGEDKPVLKTFHSIFDKFTLNQLFAYCFYSIFYEYISASHDIEHLRTDIQSSKMTRRNAIQLSRDPSSMGGFVDADTDPENEENLLEQVDIVVGNPDELKQRVCDLLLVYLEIEEEDKKTINYSYEQIIQRVNRSRDKEKKGIIDRLGNMSIEERKVEDMFKNYRLGRWNVGQQSGLIKYDQQTYDRERLELVADVDESNSFDVVTQMRMEIYDLDKQAEIDAEAEADIEQYDIHQLSENFLDGEYYEEDRDPEDDYDLL